MGTDGLLPIMQTPHGSDLDALFIIPDGTEQLGHMHPYNMHSMYVKPEPLSPLGAPSWGMFEQQHGMLNRQPTHQEVATVQQWLARAKDLQLRAQLLWEQEETELQRGAALSILNPAQAPSIALEGAPSSAMAHMNTLNSPNTMAFMLTMQGLSPTCFAEVRLLDSTPTKSALGAL
ncbi:hypothetical protein FOA52_010542 [Chlamydomonas sp. UWO 241]|nr:hypothetical protein FOA52_010542 [Chlamydomonas sp. UWO 241]